MVLGSGVVDSLHAELVMLLSVWTGFLANWEERLLAAIRYQKHASQDLSFYFNFTK